MPKTYKATYVFDEASQIYLGENTEVDGVANEGASLDELKANLTKATLMVLELMGESTDIDIELVPKS